METLLTEAVEQFIERRQVRYKPDTWRVLSGNLDRFYRWGIDQYGTHCLMSDIDDRAMARYMAQYRKLEASSFNAYRGQLVTFYKFCNSVNLHNRMPFEDVPRREEEVKMRLQLSADEIATGMDLLTEPRDRAGIAIGANTGLRAGDITRLKINNLNLTNGLLSTKISKTLTAQDIPITKELHTEMLRWFEHYAKKMGCTTQELPGHWTLIPAIKSVCINVNDPAAGRIDTYVTDSEMQNPAEIVQRMLRLLGLPTYKEGFHTLRRSAARIVNDVADHQGFPNSLRLAQAFLGHSDITTTQKYLRLTTESIQLNRLMNGQSILGESSRINAERREGDGDAGTGAVRQVS